MTADKRAVIAFIAASIANETQSSSGIYDYSRSKYFFYQVTEITRERVALYDFERNGYLRGNLSSIFDYVSGAYINISVHNNNINGFDYESGYYFGGYVSGRTVNLYDYEAMKYFIFLL